MTAIERALGADEPIAVRGWHLAERREVSRRWLAGIALTGIASSFLMGAALLGALKGRQQVVIAEAYVTSKISHNDHGSRKMGRATKTVVRVLSTNRTVIEAPTITRDGDHDIVRRQSFTFIRMGLAASGRSTISYPAFDPLSIFIPNIGVVSDASSEGYFYQSDIDSELQLRKMPIVQMSDATVAFAPGLTVDEAENAVRSNGAVIGDGNVSTGTVYVDPLRFDDGQTEGFSSLQLAARVLEANVTVTEATSMNPQTEQFEEYIVIVSEEGSIEQLLVSAGYPIRRSKLFADRMSPELLTSNLKVGDLVRIGVMQRGDEIQVVRASAYRGPQHIATTAMDDRGQFVSAAEPEKLDAIAPSTSLDNPARQVESPIPRVYDGIYRAALSYGMTVEMTTEMIGCLASAIDFLSPVKPTDRIDAFFSVSAKAASGVPAQLIYVNAHLGDVDTRLYRYRDPKTGTSGYYDQDGKSIQQALLRNPVPTASPNSSFGMRQHPVLGYARIHTGVDFAAPSGTPIVSSGAGTVVKAGWDGGGYGNQTVIRHPGGYVSSYSHQSAIAKGLKPGVRVKQGEIIGFVGSTGMATGAHLHYELSVNGSRVNPLSIRLPVGQSLQGDVRVNFLRERQKIDALLASPLGRGPKNS